MTLDSAINAVYRSEDDIRKREPEEIDVETLTNAARQLVTQVFELTNELERERARGCSPRAGGPRVEGHPLHQGRDDGGRRDYLAGRSVHAGQSLYLLTTLGWQPVRYESNMPNGPASLYFSLPGSAYEEVRIPASPRMRLAWPDEMGSMSRGLLDRH